MKRANGMIRTIALSVAVFSATVIISLQVIGNANVELELENDAEDAAAPCESKVLTVEDVCTLIPTDWTILPTKRKSKGWQQTGFAKIELEDAHQTIVELMKQNGYVLKLREPQESTNLSARPTKHLLAEYGLPSGKGKVMWALWQEGPNRTGFSWGIPR